MGANKTFFSKFTFKWFKPHKMYWYIFIIPFEIIKSFRYMFTFVNTIYAIFVIIDIYGFNIDLNYYFYGVHGCCQASVAVCRAHPYADSQIKRMNRLIAQ